VGKRHRKIITGSNLFFTTMTTRDRVDVFTDNQGFSIAQQELFKTAELKNCYLMGYVIMPNHLHLLIGSNEGGGGLYKFVQSYKGIIRKRLVGNEILWDRGFDDLVIKGEEQFRIKLGYIHNNPVKRGLVESPDKWRFSSYLFWVGSEENEHLHREFIWMTG